MLEATTLEREPGDVDGLAGSPFEILKKFLLHRREDATSWNCRGMQGGDSQDDEPNAWGVPSGKKPASSSSYSSSRRRRKAAKKAKKADKKSREASKKHRDRSAESDSSTAKKAKRPEATCFDGEGQ